MSADGRKIITIVGASGVQGGSIAHAFLAHAQDWRVRGVTRDPNSKRVAKANEQHFPAIEWVKADINDRASLVAAFIGSYAVYGVTSAFDDSLMNNREQEITQGKNIAEAAVAARVTLLFWSCLPDTRELSHGEFTGLKHTYMKAEVTKYIKQQVDNGNWPIKPFYILPGSYIQNYLYRFPPKKDKDGTVIFSLPASSNVKLDIVDIEQLGEIVYAMAYSYITAASPQATINQYINKELVVVGERITGGQMAETYSEVTGEPARYEQMTDDTFIKLAGGDSRAKELNEMFHYYDKYGLYGNKYNLKEAEIFKITLSDFRAYLHKTRFRVGQPNDLKERYTKE